MYSHDNNKADLYLKGLILLRTTTIIPYFCYQLGCLSRTEG